MQREKIRIGEKVLQNIYGSFKVESKGDGEQFVLMFAKDRFFAVDVGNAYSAKKASSSNTASLSGAVIGGIAGGFIGAVIGSAIGGAMAAGPATPDVSISKLSGMSREELLKTGTYSFEMLYSDIDSVEFGLDRKLAIGGNVLPILERMGRDFQGFLNSIGFKTELIFSKKQKRLIKLEESSINYIVNDIGALSSTQLEFIIELPGRKIPNPKIKLRVKKENGKIISLFWESKNVGLCAALNNDRDLMQKMHVGLENVALSGQHCGTGTWWWLIPLEMQSRISENCISIYMDFLEKKIPSKEYFQGMEKVAQYIRAFCLPTGQPQIVPPEWAGQFAIGGNVPILERTRDMSSKGAAIATVERLNFYLSEGQDVEECQNVVFLALESKVGKIAMKPEVFQGVRALMAPPSQQSIPPSSPYCGNERVLCSGKQANASPAQLGVQTFYCMYCGKQNVAIANFCGACGRKLK